MSKTATETVTQTRTETVTETEERTEAQVERAPQDRYAVPTHLGDGDRYAVERVLGEGALGRTYLAKDSKSHQRVAIKELQPGRLKTWKDLELFEREAAMLRSLSHEGVPSYLDHFESEPEAGGAPRYYLVQQYIMGQTLEEELTERTVFTEADVRQLAEDVLEILVYLHGLNPPIIHRDIKPSNLIRNEKGKVVLIDFGAVREVLDASDSEEGSTLVGTFGYMPPEQYAGQAFPQTDLFALGATCAHLIAGVVPERLFGDLFHIEIPEDIRLSLGFRRWLEKMLEPDLERRFRSAKEALDDLREGFLMETEGVARAGHRLPAHPGRAPRPLPGFHFKDPSRGTSHMFAIWISIFAAVVTLALPITTVLLAQPVWLALGIPVVIAAVAIAVSRVRRAKEALSLYPIAEHTIGEVTRAFLSTQGSQVGMNVSARYLEFRYYVEGRYYTGHLTTSHKILRDLRSGDPIAILYDPEEPERHLVFAG